MPVYHWQYWGYPFKEDIHQSVAYRLWRKMEGLPLVQYVNFKGFQMV